MRMAANLQKCESPNQKDWATNRSVRSNTPLTTHSAQQRLQTMGVNTRLLNELAIVWETLRHKISAWHVMCNQEKALTVPPVC